MQQRNTIRKYNKEAQQGSTTRKHNKEAQLGDRRANEVSVLHAVHIHTSLLP
jgi:hypothetical protein